MFTSLYTVLTYIIWLWMEVNVYYKSEKKLKILENITARDIS